MENRSSSDDELPKFGSYQTTKFLDSGAFGDVYKATDIKGNIYALKVSKLKINQKHAKPIEESLQNEFEILKGCNHPNVLKCHDAFKDKLSNRFVIVLEFAKKGSLRKILNKQVTSFKVLEVKKMLEQIIEGLRYLHDKKIFHRDLKVDNILVDERRDLKISDFSISKQTIVSSLSTKTSKSGTAYYMAPEQKIDGHFTEKSDIYSLGILAYELTYLCVPFQPNEARLLGVKNLDEYAQLRGDPQLSGKFEQNGINQVIRGFLEVNPEQRMSLGQALDILNSTADEPDTPNPKKKVNSLLKLTQKPSKDKILKKEAVYHQYCNYSEEKMEYDSGSYYILDLESLEKDNLEETEGIEIDFVGLFPNILFAGQQLKRCKKLKLLDFGFGRSGHNIDKPISAIAEGISSVSETLAFLYFRLFDQPVCLQSLRQLFDSFSKCKNLNEICFTFGDFGGAARQSMEFVITEFLSKISKLKNLTSLNLIFDHYGFTKPCVKELIKALENYEFLEEFTLLCNHGIGGLDSEGLEQICNILKKCQDLTKFQIQCTNDSNHPYNYHQISDSGFFAVAELLTVQNQIEEFWFECAGGHHCYGDKGIESLANAFRKCNRLTKIGLNLSNYSYGKRIFSNSAIGSLLEAIQSCKYLNRFSFECQGLKLNEKNKSKLAQLKMTIADVNINI